jgi:DNA-directed RNA polymerase specialized sigma24 family protein
MPVQGDTFTQLVAKHQRRLLGYLRARVRNDEDAEDLAQQTLIEVWRHEESFKPELGSPWRFIRIWADIVLKRYWTKVQDEALLIPLGPGADEPDGDAAGFEPSHHPDFAAQVDASEAFLELLCRAAACHRPPHEVIAFGFCKLLGWKPGEVVASLSHASLRDLATRLEDDYRAFVPLLSVQVALCPLRHKLDWPLRQCARDPRTRGVYEQLLDRQAGVTVLEEYYPADEAPEAAVTHWWDFVKRAVFAEILEAGSGPLLERMLRRGSVQEAPRRRRQREA